MNGTNKKFKDPGSAITHLIAMIGAVILVLFHLSAKQYTRIVPSLFLP